MIDMSLSFSILADLTLFKDIHPPTPLPPRLLTAVSEPTVTNVLKILFRHYLDKVPSANTRI